VVRKTGCRSLWPWSRRWSRALTLVSAPLVNGRGMNYEWAEVRVAEFIAALDQHRIAWEGPMSLQSRGSSTLPRLDATINEKLLTIAAIASEINPGPTRGFRRSTGPIPGPTHPNFRPVNSCSVRFATERNWPRTLALKAPDSWLPRSTHGCGCLQQMSGKSDIGATRYNVRPPRSLMINFGQRSIGTGKPRQSRPASDQRGTGRD
jgi:hypothetical protein